MRLLKIFIKLFVLFFILSIVFFPLIFLKYGLESEPLVVSGRKLALDDVARVKQLLRQNDPRNFKAGDIKNVSFTERDLNLFLDYALAHTPDNKKVSAEVFLNYKLAITNITIVLPNNPFGKYLNISLLLAQSSNIIAVRKLKVGKLKVPGLLLNTALRFGHRFLRRYKEYREIEQGVKSIESIILFNNRVSVTYQWNPEVMNRIQEQGRKLLVPDEDRKRLVEYYKQISIISYSLDKKNVSLSEFLSPLFKFAQQRTTVNNNPIAENRALILSSTIYSTRRNISTIIGKKYSAEFRPPRKLNLLLGDRDDLALHFLVSAAITVSGGSGLANLAGIFKELDDSQGGSGFSFADLTADQAGVKLAETAIKSSRSARILQKQMSGYLRESDYMPATNNLPEGIMELEFRHKYHDLDSATYKKINNEISRRISQCRIYH